jgi:hypothetical protein
MDEGQRKKISSVTQTTLRYFQYSETNVMHQERSHVSAIEECVTAVLRSIPKEACADSLQKLYERCQQCVVKDGDYFEGQ